MDADAGERTWVGLGRLLGRDRDVPTQAVILARAFLTSAGAGGGATWFGIGIGIGIRDTGRRTSLHVLEGLFISSGAGHAEEKVVLILDQEDQDILTEFVFLRSHVMLRMRDGARLEDGRQIGRRHPVQVGLGGKHRQKIEDVEEELSVERGEFADQLLVCRHRLRIVQLTRLGGLRIGLGLSLVGFEGFAEAVVELERHDGLRELIQVSAEDIGGIVDSIAGPVQTFSVAFGGVKDLLQVLDAFGGAADAEDALDVGGYFISAVGSRR